MCETYVKHILIINTFCSLRAASWVDLGHLNTFTLTAVQLLQYAVFIILIYGIKLMVRVKFSNANQFHQVHRMRGESVRLTD